MKREIREQARVLRLQGMSVRDICLTLGVAKSSISLWVRDIELTQDQVEKLKQKQHLYGAQHEGGRTNRKKYLELRKAYQEEGRARAKEGSPLHLAGCMLYWAEGAKHRNRVVFVNSDTNMMCMFIHFLREEFKIADSDFSLQIHCHKVEDISRIEQYWLDTLKLTNSCLQKTQVKAGSDSRRNILENGVCGLYLGNTRVAMHIYGAIQEYAGFEHPAWLF